MTLNVTVSPANESSGQSTTFVWTARLSDASNITVTLVEANVNFAGWMTAYSVGSGFAAGYSGASSSITGAGTPLVVLAIQPTSAFAANAIVQYRLSNVTAGTDTASTAPYAYQVSTQFTYLGAVPKSIRSSNQ